MVIKYFHEKCTYILYNRLLGYPLNREDTEFLMSIFPLHPRFRDKVAGRDIKCIIIRRHEEYHNKCFALVFSDNSFEYISFTKCLGQISRVHDDIIVACKKIISDISNKIISDWLMTFRFQEITLFQFIDYPEIVFNNSSIIDSFREFVINKTQSKELKSLINEGETLNISETK